MIEAQVHCGLESPGVGVGLHGRGRLFHWTVISGMKLRIQYVGVVALRRGRTKKRAWERVLALAGGARGGQRDHRGSGRAD